jgi:6-phosphofructokinase 1
MTNKIRKIGISTGGGDAPGLNAVIRAAVKTAINEYGWEVYGIRDGLDGLFQPGGVFQLGHREVRGILHLGGTILGTANRGNPFAQKTIGPDGEEVITDISDEYIKRIELFGLDALIMIGGDGSLYIANEFHKRGVKVVGVPKTIDNDVGLTDMTFGFDTAVNIAMEALDRLHTTAESHHRVMILELMGRDAGFIALRAGVAGGADIILLPEIPFNFDSICHKVNQRVARGHKFSIVAIAEGAYPAGGQRVFSRHGADLSVERLGGIGQTVGRFIQENCGAETRVTVLGHIQRGGSPTALDRWLSTRYGGEATRLIAREQFGHMVALSGRDIVAVPFEDVLAKPKRVRVNVDTIQTARALGISFGD